MQLKARSPAEVQPPTYYVVVPGMHIWGNEKGDDEGVGFRGWDRDRVTQASMHIIQARDGKRRV